MKIVFILLLTVSLQLLAQEKTENDKVDDYLNYLKSYSQDESKLMTFQNVSDSEIKKFLRLQTEAYCSDTKKIYIKGHEYVQELNKAKIIRSSYSQVEAIFGKIIKKRYSEKFWEFQLIPYLIRARITSVKDTIYKIKANDIQYMDLGVTEIEFIADEVLKGNNDFTAGNTYKCYFGRGWANPNGKFIVGQSYLLPLDPRNADPDYTVIVNAIITYLDNNAGCYKIENGYLLDTYNFFSFGEKVEWKDFVGGLQKKFDMLKKGEF
jgi:hypothetical protein